jgi:hypothetical protein
MSNNAPRRSPRLNPPSSENKTTASKNQIVLPPPRKNKTDSKGKKLENETKTKTGEKKLSKQKETDYQVRIENLEKEIERLNQELKNTGDRIYTNLNDKRSNAADLEHCRKELSQNADTYTTVIDEKKQELKEQREIIKNLEGELEKVQKENNDRKKNMVKLLEENNNLQKSANINLDCVKDLDDHKKIIEQQKSANKALQNENTTLQQRANKYKEEIKTLQNEKQSASEIDGAKQALEKNLNALRTKYNQLNEENKKLRGETDSKMSVDTSEAVEFLKKNHQAEMNKLQQIHEKQIKELQDSLTVKENGLFIAMKSLQDAKEKEKLLQTQLKTIVENNEKSNKELYDQNKKLKQALVELTNSNMNFQNANEILNEKYIQSQNNATLLTEKLNSSSSKVQALMNDNQSLLTETKELKLRNETLQNTNYNQNETIDRLESACVTNKNQTERISELENLITTLTNTSTITRELKSQISKLEFEKIDLENTLRRTQDTMIRENHGFTQQEASSLRIRNELISKIANLEKDSNILRAQIKNQEDETKLESDKNQILEKQVQDLQTKLTAAKEIAKLTKSKPALLEYSKHAIPNEEKEKKEKGNDADVEIYTKYQEKMEKHSALIQEWIRAQEETKELVDQLLQQKPLSS